MKLFDLGTLPWKDTQLIYHALAHANIEALVLHSCDEPYVCLGFPYNPNDELDLDYCRTNSIPFFRREIGGGTVLLDSDQIFIHLIVNRDNPLAPRSQVPFFRKFLGPVISTYRDLGIPVEYRPVSDLAVNGKKISGTGGGEINDSLVMGSSILLDFNYGMMADILKVPNKEFREKVLESMENNLTNVRRELGHVPSRRMIRDRIISHFTEIFGELEPGELTSDILETKEKIEKKLMGDKWVFQRGMRTKGRNIKIIEGVNIVHREYSYDGMKIDLVLEINQKRIAHISVMKNGEYCVWKELERELLDMEFDESNIENAIAMHKEE